MFDREKLIRSITELLEAASELQLRIIYQIIYHMIHG